MTSDGNDDSTADGVEAVFLAPGPGVRTARDYGHVWVKQFYSDNDGKPLRVYQCLICHCVSNTTYSGIPCLYDSYG